MAANVLGFVGLDDKGLDGLEMSLDDLIRGGKSKQMLLTDAREIRFWSRLLLRTRLKMNDPCI